MTSLNSLGVLMSIPQDEFKIYSWKKVMWISLSALNRTSGLTPDHPLITDEEYIINRAIRKPDLKVSKCIASLRCQRIKESFILCVEFTCIYVLKNASAVSHRLRFLIFLRNSLRNCQKVTDHSILWPEIKLTSDLFIPACCRLGL